ncbi:MAG: PQQ-like beta-propeller repeat protein [Phycisphaerales bacterium]|nr:PQQ-like beta-propeller repeat protein [Phycisphaerales bacterium]
MPISRLTPHRVACALAAAVAAAVLVAQTAQPVAQPAVETPANPMERAADSGAQIYVDDSFTAVDKLCEAANKAKQGQVEVVIKKYQDIIDNYGQKLVYLNNDSYVSITDFVREQLLAMPAVKDGMYDSLFGTDAKKAVEEAVARRDITNLLRVCDRYFPATTSLDGLSLAAEWHFERGEFAAAARIWELLLKHPMVSPKSSHRAVFLFRSLVAEHFAGNSAKAKLLRERLAMDFPHATGPVSGQETDLLEAADTMLALPEMVQTELIPNEWPTFQGGPSRRALPHVNASVDARLWSIPLDDESIIGVKKNATATLNEEDLNVRLIRRRQGIDTDANLQMLDSYPVMSNGILFLHTGERVVALSANAGTLLWAYPVRPMPRNNPGYMDYGYPYRASSHNSVTVFDGQVFAILPAAADTASPDVRRRYMPYAGMGNTRLVCIDQQAGQEVWSVASSSVKLEKPGQLAFIGSPIVTRQGVFVIGRKMGDGGFAEIYLIRLERSTGKPEWSCYLCSASSLSAYYGMPNLSGTIPIPTLADDVVYISTGQGVDCAVDANAGRILWLQITPAAKTSRSPSEMYNPQPPTPSRKSNPPLVFGDKLITCESVGGGGGVAAGVRIYNRENGEVIRSIAKTQLGMSTLDVLAGIVGNKAFLVGTAANGGSAIVALDLVTLTKSKDWEISEPRLSAETGRQQGRPFLSADTLYVPYEKGMLFVNTATAAQDFHAWQATENDKKLTYAKPGNLLVTSEQVIVLNDSEIAGYSKWETAYANRLADIRRNASDANPELALAEVAFRTAHYDISQEHMTRAVSLATSLAPGSAGGSVGLPAGFGTRLYQTNLNFARQLLGNADINIRDHARFYFGQCRLTARDAAQQAEWRLCMSELSLAQNNAVEAAELYHQVLADPAMRNAKITRGESTARAAVTAEQLFLTLINKPNGPEIYKRYEGQAQALLNKARDAKDAGALSVIVESFPNSKAAVAAATDLANAARDARNFAGQLQHLHWLYSHVTGDRRAAVTADTAVAYFSLPKPHYNAALSFADRGLRQFKNFAWTDPATNQTMTFATLRDHFRNSRPTGLVEGRLPILPPPVVRADGTTAAPEMDLKIAMENPLFEGTLLSPLETSPNLRRPDLIFAVHNGALHIYDAARHVELTTPQKRPNLDVAIESEGGIQLDNAPAALLGCVGNIAVVAQSNALIGINLADLKNKPIAWKRTLVSGGSGERGEGEAHGAVVVAGGRVRIQGGGQLIITADGRQQVIGGPSVPISADPDAARQIALSQLAPGGRPVFNTLRIINDKVIAVVGDKVSALDLATGEPAWKNASGMTIESTLPADSIAGPVVGNEDYIVIQADIPAAGKTAFQVLNADTGSFRKQLEIAQERTAWRNVSDDGTLFLVTDKSVLAFDLVNERDSQPLWKRQDIRCNYPTATALTTDGLMVISNNAILCLSPEGGDTRWPSNNAEPVALTLLSINQRLPFLRTIVDGDTLIYQSLQGLVAYHTIYPSPNGDLKAWDGTLTQPIPPLQTMQISDPYLVVLASGPIEGATRAVKLYFLKKNGGKLDMETLLTLPHTSNTSPPSRSMEGPLVQNWQVVDNGVVLQINNRVHFYRGTIGTERYGCVRQQG